MLQRLPRKLVAGEVIFLTVMRGCGAMSVRGHFVEFGCSLVRIIRHDLLPLDFISHSILALPNLYAGARCRDAGRCILGEG